MNFSGYEVPLSLIAPQLQLEQFIVIMGEPDEYTSRYIELFGMGSPSETVRLLVAIGCIAYEGRQHGWTQRYFDSRLRSLIIFNTAFPDRVCFKELMRQAAYLARI